MDLTDHEAEVARLRRNTVSRSSRAAYRGSTVKFLQWMYVHKHHLLSDGWLSWMIPDANGDVPKANVRDALNQVPIVHPLKFSEITAQDFMTWMVTLKKADGTRPGYSSFNTHRAALFNLFRDCGYTMSRDLETELKNHFIGLKRDHSKNIAAGNVLALSTLALEDS